jgi:hypothetical protein
MRLPRECMGGVWGQPGRAGARAWSADAGAVGSPAAPHPCASSAIDQMRANRETPHGALEHRSTSDEAALSRATFRAAASARQAERRTHAVCCPANQLPCARSAQWVGRVSPPGASCERSSKIRHFWTGARCTAPTAVCCPANQLPKVRSGWEQHAPAAPGTRAAWVCGW